MRSHASAVRAQPGRAAVAVTGLLVAAALIAQIPLAIGLLDYDVMFEARNATTVLAVNAALALLTVVAAVLLPARRRPLALLPGGLAALGFLAASVTLGEHAVDLVAAVLTFAAAWWAGRGVIALLGVRELRGVYVVELACGFGVVGLVVLLLGRLDALAWWSTGVLLVAFGLAGLWASGRETWPRRDALWATLTGSPIAVACTGLLLLQAGWTLVWLSAPEIMYDALSSKAYLPELWARTGEIAPMIEHPVMNVTGLSQIVAVPGHTLGGADVGRWIELLAWLTIVATTWWWGRGSVAGPVAALLVGVVPQIVWQATTAYDDLMLTIGGMAIAIAVLRTAGRSRARDGTPEPGSASAAWRVALAIGLLGGTCVWLKLNLAPFAVLVALGWVLAGGPARQFVQRAGGTLAGGLAIAGPALILRWIDTGNPVFPNYNSLFKSDNYLHVNEKFNFPYWRDVSTWEVVKLPWDMMVEPALMNDSTPPGSFGVLVAAIAIAVLIGWRGGRRPATLVVWGALVVGLLLWWLQFRYLRYILPMALVAVLLVLVQLRQWRPGRAAGAALLVSVAAASALYLPSTVASFWNVPRHEVPFAAAFGRWGEEDYLRNVFPEKDAVDVYRRVAPPDAMALSDTHVRTLMDGRDLTPAFELEGRLLLDGPVPETADEAYERVRELGVDWALLTGINLTPDARPWVQKLIAGHGEPVFADRGFVLFRLVEDPARPRMLPCDDALRGVDECWSATFDRRAGLVDGESAGGATRLVPVCPGQTLSVELTTAPGGDPATVTLDADSGSAISGHTSGTVSDDATGRVYATAPGGTRTIGVRITPGANGGAIESARLGLLGSCGA